MRNFTVDALVVFWGCLKPPKLPRWVPRSGMGIFGGGFWDLASMGFTGDVDGLWAPGRKLRLSISAAKRRSRGGRAQTIAILGISVLYLLL